MRMFFPSLSTLFLWDINNLDPVRVRVEKILEDYQLINLDNGINSESDFIRNSIVSKKKKERGTFRFTAISVLKLNEYAYHSFGLYVDNSNRIELYRENTAPYNISYRIIHNGIEVYNVDDIMTDFGQFKITIDEFDVIKLHKWNGINWIQQGVSQTYVMGDKMIFASLCGGEISKVSLNNCSIS